MKPKSIESHREGLDDIPLVRGAQPNERLFIVRMWCNGSGVLMLVGGVGLLVLDAVVTWPSVAGVIAVGGLGTVIAYVGLATLLNRTTIVVEPRRIEVSIAMLVIG